jgi:hypothetical protein
MSKFSKEVGKFGKDLYPNTAVRVYDLYLNLVGKDRDTAGYPRRKHVEEDKFQIFEDPHQQGRIKTVFNKLKVIMRTLGCHPSQNNGIANDIGHYQNPENTSENTQD